jgi:flagellar assembly factor FliW
MPSSKAAASEEARRTLRYVEPLSDARTPLADFFSILLVVQDNIEKSTVHLNCAVVVNKSQRSELIQK